MSNEELFLELHDAKIKYLQDDVEIITSELKSNYIKNETLQTIVNEIRQELNDITMRIDKLFSLLQHKK